MFTMVPSTSSTASSSSVKMSSKSTRNRKNLKSSSSYSTSSSASKIILSQNLPVASKPPVFPSDASALRPGSLLQQICNGKDIQLARSAIVTSSVEREKGKFLLIFPGTFSFNINQHLVKTDDDDDGDKSKNNEKKEIDNEKSSNKKKIQSKDQVSFGQLQCSRTEEPTFKIPFPNINKDLIFPGRKIHTTSKYLIMSCSNKKNGTVQCKSVFSSIIVFGSPRWVSSNEKIDSGNVDIKVCKSQTFLHYGAKRSSKKGLSAPLTTSEDISIKKIPIRTKRDISDSSSDNHSESDESFEIDLSKTSKKGDVVQTTHSERKRRLPPKRQASIKKKRYVEEEIDISSDSSSSIASVSVVERKKSNVSDSINNSTKRNCMARKIVNKTPSVKKGLRDTKDDEETDVEEIKMDDESREIEGESDDTDGLGDKKDVFIQKSRKSSVRQPKKQKSDARSLIIERRKTKPIATTPSSLSLGNSTPTRSPFRRRKKSPAKTKSSARKLLDLTQDDEFLFS